MKPMNRREPIVEYGQPARPKPQEQPKPETPKVQRTAEQVKPRKKELPGKKHFERYMGEKLTVQAKSGVIYIGTLEAFEDGGLRLADVEIKGPQHTAKTFWLWVDRNQIGHFHPFDAEVKRNV